MKKLILGSVLAALAFASLNSYANCALAAVMNPPSLPEVNASAVEDMPNLRFAVKEYLDRASQRLEVCEGYSDDFVYNVAVARLEETADHYNQLVRYHKQLQVSAK
ncbi:hypothetical protein [Zhongshania sp.]|uniref:hypothetical protein n=1 Tax=Zhongshania sp. TaxID=1971902 RepID=UPI0035693C3D